MGIIDCPKMDRAVLVISTLGFFCIVSGGLNDDHNRLNGQHILVSVIHVRKSISMNQFNDDKSSFFLKEPPIFSAIRNPKNASSVQFTGLTVDIIDELAKYLNFT